MLELLLKEINKKEQSLVLKLNNKLKRINKEPSYLIDKSIPHAKYNYKENLIRLNNQNIFQSIVHEQLHAILINCYNFPSIDEISNLSKNYNLQRLNGLVIDIYNDFHHFVFFLEFKRITEGKSLIINEEKLLNPEFKFDFLRQKFIEKQNYLEKVKVFYDCLFIPYKYKKLINKGTLDWRTESLSQLDNELFQILTNLFDLKIEFSLQKNGDYYKDVINYFSSFFENLNKYAFPT